MWRVNFTKKEGIGNALIVSICEEEGLKIVSKEGEFWPCFCITSVYFHTKVDVDKFVKALQKKLPGTPVTITEV